MKGFKLVLLLVVPLLFACASGDEALVAKGDWKGIGYADGMKGKTQRSYATLNELGSANMGAYEEGYSQGVKEYCNPNFAYQIGLSGQYYNGVCEGSEDALKFRMEWQRGWNEQN
ncbi:hypothetical protein A9264_07565 [Vibrio sp. UCD-FRSSP16_10]|uniref:DUF2799 domain-containing protein n=1 Tax=unclassified Vibrio TaxID=2614977 RepID=UPI0007FFA845|nr:MULTISPECIES: DUF2799 domain-containing protein [unclassified Vibrio]OBT07291.1 hypothetical protein A9260_08350 [Vibrio sp. UCD-FRSSP16_30]OBT12771.1 hypothetical protein A9264_07565 [Vibrio sp. UCD-FRSSP16_10]